MNIQILEKTQDFLLKKSQKDCLDYRLSSKDLIRNRCLSFISIVLFLISLKKKSLGISLEEFASHFENHRVPSKSAFTQARYKLKWEFFEDWSSELVKNCTPYYRKTWKGFRLYGIDGSTLSLPDNKAMRKEFKFQVNDKCVKSQARIMCCYDVLNGFCYRAKLGSMTDSEVGVAYEWVKDFDSDSLCIYDRGFASFALIYLHQLYASNFVIRCQKNFNKSVSAFNASGKKSMVMDFQISNRAKEILLEQGIILDDSTTVKVRLLQIKLKTGEDEILITSLTDARKYRYNLFKDLYFLRWKTEVFYDRLKNKAQIEVFIGHKPVAVKQEFHATIFLLNLQNLAIQQTSEQVRKNTKNRKYPYQTNYNVSFGFIAINVAELLKIGSDMTWFWEKIKAFCIKHVEPIRINREYPRKVGKHIKLNGKFYTATNYRRAI